MRARLTDVPVGTRFRTCITGRAGVVREHRRSYVDGNGGDVDGGVAVEFEDGGPKVLHSRVVVLLAEVTH